MPYSVEFKSFNDMNARLFILILAANSLLFAACSSTKGPEAVAKQAVEALKKGDYDTYAATFDLSSSDQKMFAGMAEEKVDEEISDKGGIKSYKIVDSLVNGDSATVRVLIVYKDASEEYQTMDFAKVNGVWKQEMDK